MSLPSRHWIASLVLPLCVAGCGSEPIQSLLHGGPADREARARVLAVLAAQGPLAAERALEERAVATPRVSDRVLGRLQHQIGARGRERCGALTAASGADSPYLTDLARRYCMHFGVEPPPDATRAEAVSGVEVTVAFEGARGEIPLRVLERGLEGSYWHDPRAARTKGRVAGSASMLRQQVPDTLELYPGEFLPPGAPRETRRLTIRSAQEAVDAALRGRAAETPLREDLFYGANLELGISLPGPELEFTTRVDRVWRTPARAVDSAPLSLEAWLEREVPALAESVTQMLDAFWIERICTHVTSVEQAARCVHGPLTGAGGASLAPSVQGALELLRSAIGEDPSPLFQPRAAR